MMWNSLFTIYSRFAFITEICFVINVTFFPFSINYELIELENEWHWYTYTSCKNIILTDGLHFRKELHILITGYSQRDRKKNEQMEMEI